MTDAASVAVQTHGSLRHDLSGEPVEIGSGAARVRLVTGEAMRADAEGLVHGGFVFSLADHAAMLAINEPTVVLGGADCRFLAPVRVGDVLEAIAERDAIDGKKQGVNVRVVRVPDGAQPAEASDTGEIDDAAADLVFEGDFTCFVPSRHVLAAREEE
ncbi:MAG: PaaI family thioesterase [Acidobacteriota bacterium]